MRDRKAPHRDAVDLLDAGRQLVAPGDVVAGAGRQDLDLGVPREVLGDVARVQLRAAVDVGAVALDDDRELHDSRGRRPSAAIGRGRLARLAPRPGRVGCRRLRPALACRRPARVRPAAAAPRRRAPARAALRLRRPTASRRCRGRRRRPAAAAARRAPGRYCTTPSSARARRSSKSSRLDIDSTRIFRFFTSMPSARQSRAPGCGSARSRARPALALGIASRSASTGCAAPGSSGFGLKNSFRIGLQQLADPRGSARGASRRASCPRTRSSRRRRRRLARACDTARADRSARRAGSRNFSSLTLASSRISSSV